MIARTMLPVACSTADEADEQGLEDRGEQEGDEREGVVRNRRMASGIAAAGMVAEGLGPAVWPGARVAVDWVAQAATIRAVKTSSRPRLSHGRVRRSASRTVRGIAQRTGS